MDSALARAQDPEGAGAGWDRQAQLLALIAEVADVTNAILVKVNSDPKKPQPKLEPLRITRPGRPAQQEAEQLTGDALEASFKAMGGQVIKGKRKRAN